VIVTPDVAPVERQILHESPAGGDASASRASATKLGVVRDFLLSSPRKSSSDNIASGCNSVRQTAAVVGRDSLYPVSLLTGGAHRTPSFPPDMNFPRRARRSTNFDFISFLVELRSHTFHRLRRREAQCVLHLLE
jgi:hypothetical protein